MLWVLIANEETDYIDAYKKMMRIVEHTINNHDHILITQHKPVITLGKDSKPWNIKNKPPNIPIIKIDRGGDVTLHSPGQLMIYPIIRLDRRRLRLVDLIRALEESVIKFIEKYGLKGYWKKGTAGVWVENRKIASIGIGLKKWVSYHGMAFNISNDLELFNYINPCGLDPSTMTNLSKETGKEIKITKGLIKDYLNILLNYIAKKDEEIHIFEGAINEIPCILEDTRIIK